MAYSKKNWKNRVSEYPNRYRMTSSNGNIADVSIVPLEGTVTTTGDRFAASTMNDFETRIQNGFNDAQTNLENVQTVLEQVVADEETRARTAEGGLANEINLLDHQVNADLQAEVTRATGVEGGLNTRLTTAEGNIGTLQSSMTTVTQTANSALSAAQDAQANLTIETSRAQQAETTLQGNINTVSSAITGEVSRATTAETALSNRVTTLENTLTTIYKPAGSIYFANLPQLSPALEGNVYNIKDSFTTTAQFLEGAGNSYPPGANIAIISIAETTYTAVTPVGTENPKALGWYTKSGNTYTKTNDTTVNSSKTYYERSDISYYYDVLSGFVDLSNYVEKTDYGTTSDAGVVKPDGSTITVDNDGTIHSVGTGVNGVTYVGTCSTAADTATKAVTVTNTSFELTTGVRIGVKFANTNSASNVKIKVNSTAAKSIYYSSSVYTGSSEKVTGYADRYVYYVYDGTYWVWDGWGVDENTKYSAMSQAEANTGTETTARIISSSVLRNTAIPTGANAPTFANLADFWTYAESLMGYTNLCSFRCKFSPDFGFGTGWWRVIVGEQNRVGNGTNAIAGHVLAMNSGALRYFVVNGGKTDTSDLDISTLGAIATEYFNLSIAETQTGTETASRFVQPSVLSALLTAKAPHFGTCATAAATPAKVVTVSDSNFVLYEGVMVTVKFSESNSASNCTINVNNTGAYQVYYNNDVNTGDSVYIFGTANRHTTYQWDGTYWVWVSNSYLKDTTYSAMSTNELVTGTATTKRVMQANLLNPAIDQIIGEDVTIGGTGTASSSAVHYQRVGINGTYTTIDGTMYMEQTKTLSTSADTTFTFTNSNITADSVIDVYASIWGIHPSEVSATAGSCTVKFSAYTSAVSLKCRIYIK